MKTSFWDFVDGITRGWAEHHEKEAKEAARKKAEWEAIPEEERQRIIAIREKEELRLKSERLEREKWRAEQEREKQLAEWRRRGITPRFYDAAWENWNAKTPEQKNALEKIKQAWEKNLFIVGENGTGKTHLAMCLAKDGATYCLLPELFRSVRENLNGEQETIDRYGSCKLLTLDEVGRQKGTDFERNLLFEIIDKRWNNMLPTTFIGNIGQEEFVALCGTAILDRLQPLEVKFNWESKRA